MILEILCLLSAGILGIFLGAQICEGVLFVPYWKSLAPKYFFELHRTYGNKIHQFFAPLTITATIIPTVTAVYSLVSNSEGGFFSVLMAIFTLLFFSTYFAYFKKANKAFTEMKISYEQLPKELNRWGNWHWIRIGLEFFSFIFSLLALIHI